MDIPNIHQQSQTLFKGVMAAGTAAVQFPEAPVASQLEYCDILGQAPPAQQQQQQQLYSMSQRHIPSAFLFEPLYYPVLPIAQTAPAPVPHHVPYDPLPAPASQLVPQYPFLTPPATREATPTKRTVGRPRKHPRKDESAPKGKAGRPKGSSDQHTRLPKGAKQTMTHEERKAHNKELRAKRSARKQVLVVR
jgi:hypothetical protein